MNKVLLKIGILMGATLLFGCAYARISCPKADPLQTSYSPAVYNDAVIRFEKSSDPNNPIDVVLYRGGSICTRTVVDRYSVAGSAPEVVAVFPYALRGMPNIFVIVAWRVNSRGLGTYGELYQVYAYEKDGQGGLKSNKLIAKSDEMTGLEGTADGEPSHFEGRDEGEVKKLVDQLPVR